MFEPPILDQLMGVGALLLGFVGLYRHIKMQEQRKEEERRLQEEYDTQVVRACNKLLEMGREIEREQIRKNIRREFKGFAYDNEPPQGLRPEPLALPEPRRSRYAKHLG